VFASSWLLAALAVAGRAGADVGDLGAPPTDPEVRQTVTDLYSLGVESSAHVDVEFDGPINVLGIAQHMRYHLIIPMYRVYAPVTVTVTRGPYDPVEVLHNGGDQCEGTDCAFYFYRDGAGNWQATYGSSDARSQQPAPS